MDWFSWLSKTGLEPSLVYEYGLAFSLNELEEADMAYFNHEFLQSMGISIGKHRLEILKLARKERGSIPHPMSRILMALRRTKSCLSKYLRTWVRREDSTLALVPRPSARRKNALLRRNKRSMLANKKQSRAPLLLTNGRPLFFPSSRINNFSSPLLHGFQRTSQRKDGDSSEYWLCAGEKVRWDAMFQNLKPT